MLERADGSPPLRYQTFGDHHEHVFERGLFFGETEKAAVGGHELTEKALNVTFVAVHFQRAAAVVHLDVADLRVTADDADACFGVARETDFDMAVLPDLAVDGFDRAVEQQLAALDNADRGAAVGELGENVARDEDRLAH